MASNKIKMTIINHDDIKSPNFRKFVILLVYLTKGD